MANSQNGSSAFFDVLTAVLALYFAAFAFLGYHQNGTMASLPLNQTLFKISGFVSCIGTHNALTHEN